MLDRIDKALALSQARATMYESEMGESYQFQVADRAAELGAIADGCRAAPVYIPPPPADWKDAPPPTPPGKHRVLCGDATSAEAVARFLGERKPKLLVSIQTK